MSPIKKNILIISSSFPPQADVGGIRPAMFTKYLPEFGWTPYILTREWPEGDPYRKHTMVLHGLPHYEQINRLYWGGGDERQSFQEKPWRWRLRSLLTPDACYPCGALDLFSKNLSQVWPYVSFSVVMGTVPDLYTVAVARMYAKYRGAKFLADLRDIYEQEDGLSYKYRDRFFRVRSKLRRNYLLRDADLVTVVSQFHKKIIERQYCGPVEVIYNGYDAEIFHNVNTLPRSKIFQIVYMGRILNKWYRDPSVLFAALDLLLTSGKLKAGELSVDFYGTEESMLRGIVAPFESSFLARVHPRVEYTQVPDILRQATVLLTLTNEGRKGILTTKFFEYLPIGRPILNVPGDRGELDELLAQTKAGVSCNNAVVLAATLEQWLVAWRNNSSFLQSPDAAFVGQFSRRNQTKRLAELLDGMIG